MYCESPEEVNLFETLKFHYPDYLPYMLDLIAWVYINKPQRYEEIMNEHKKLGSDELIELQDFDIKTILKKPE